MVSIAGRSRRGALLALFGLALGSTVARAEDAASGGSTVRFASVEAGRAVLAADDVWVAATSDFQRAATLGARPPVSRERFLAFSAAAVQPWPAAQESRWRKAVDTVMARVSALRVPLPREVLLVNSDGRDASNAPYTRANAIVLPTAALPQDASPYSDVELLAHELFHIVSRHSPALATQLYATIGFEPVAPLRWPAAWLSGRIANPDAPFDRHAMPVTIDGSTAMLIPLLVARRTELRPGESFFDVMDVRLLEVSVAAGAATLPVLRNGEPVWHAPERVPEFVARLGGNTGYIIHPDETMADNFAFLVSGRSVPNPALLAQIEAVLLTPR